MYLFVFMLPICYLVGLTSTVLFCKYHTFVIEPLLSYVLTLLSLIFTLLSVIALVAKAVVSRQTGEAFYALSFTLFFISGFMVLVYFYIHLMIYLIAFALALCSPFFRYRKKF